MRQWFLAGLFLLGGGAARAQNDSAPAPLPLLIRSWQTDQGLPNNTVNAIAQTPDGYLWLGTDDGLVRFDGVRSQVFGLREGLGSLQISALLADHSGALWIGTAGGGLSRLAAGRIETYTIKNGLAGNSIQVLLEATNGDVWVGTPTGLSRGRDGRFEPVGGNLGYISDLAGDRRGDIWVATMQPGLLRYHDGKLVPVNGPPGKRPFHPRCILIDHQDRLWAGSREKQLACYQNGNWTRYGTNDGLPEIILNCITETADGTVWLASLNEGLYRFQNGGFSALQRKDGLSDEAILALFPDQQFLWTGTQSGGLCRIGPKKLSVYHAMEGLSECQLRSLAETRAGELWVATYGQGLYHWQNGVMEQMQGAGFHDHAIVEAVLGGRDGSLWWGAGPSVYQWRDGKLLFNNSEHPFPGDRVWCLCEDHHGGMWVGTYNGQLEHLQDKQFMPVNGLSGRPVTSLAEAADGTLWFGSLGGGLGRLQNGQLTLFTTKDGLRSDLIRTLLLDAGGTLWIGTDGGGLARWSQGRLVSFTTQQGLMDDTILQILEDDNGSLWLGCNRGICRVYERSLNDVAEGRATSVHTLVFGRSDGMLSEACVGNFGAALRTHAGQLLFSTEKGVVAIDPSHQVNNAVPPRVLLEDVLVDGRVLTPLPVQSGQAPADAPMANRRTPERTMLTLSPGRHDFEFHFTGISFDSPERIQFKYKLEGLDAGWTEAGNLRVAHYSYVPPGAYRFLVKAGNGNELWSTDPAELSFAVPPYFWQAVWFQSLAGLLAVGLIVAGIRYYERRRYKARLRRLEQERAMERERGRIARDLHDELGSSLTYISMSVSDMVRSRETNPEQLKARLEKISGFSVRTARSLDEIVWAVNPHNDSLRSLVEYLTQLARELFEDSGVHCRFQIQDDLPQVTLPPEMRHNLFLTVKEALTNALKHAHAREIFLGARTDGRQIEITIQDRGVGFDPALIPPGKERDGLHNMRQRIQDLGGRLEVATGPGQGTTITIIVSYPPVRGVERPAQP